MTTLSRFRDPLPLPRVAVEAALPPGWPQMRTLREHHVELDMHVAAELGWQDSGLVAQLR